jgi:hypothetical protein
VTDFTSLPFYDLFAGNGHVPRIRKSLPPLLAGVRRSILEIGAGTGMITTSRPPAPHPLKELDSRRVGRHTYTALSEILDTDGEACRARYLHRITKGDKVIS